MEDEVTPDTLYDMLPRCCILYIVKPWVGKASYTIRIGECSKLLLPNKRLDVLAYGCTSASATIGEEKIFYQLSIRQVSKEKVRFLT